MTDSAPITGLNEFSAISHSLVLALDWDGIQNSPPEVAGRRLGALLRDCDGILEMVFALRGRAGLMIEERKLWEGDSFDKWLKLTCPRSWSDVRCAMRTVKALTDVPFPKLLGMKRCNVEQLKRISTTVRTQPEVLEAAEQQSEDKFCAFVMERYPDQHLEPRRPIVMADKGDVQEFEHAIEIAMTVGECATRAEAIKLIAIEFIREYEGEWLERGEREGVQ